MAPTKKSGDLYVYNLPYDVIKELSRILDRDNKWEELEMQHYRAMLVLKPLVDPKFHPLLFEGEEIQIFQNQGGAGPGGEGTQTQNDKLPTASTALLDKSMEVGSVNLNVNNGGQNASPDKVLFPVEQAVERKINTTPENVVSSDCNSSVMSNAAALAPVVPRQVESKELNCPASNPQRKMSNASDASSMAELCMTIPQIAYNELMQATDNWSKANILGKGGFGTVFKGKWKNTLVAIKRIEQRGAESGESYQTQMEQSLRELRILNACRHDNILPVYGFSVGGAEPCLVYQYMPNGSLEDRLMCRNRTIPLTWLQRHNIAVGTARGLQFLHTNEMPFIHGDIKSANILLNNHFEPRIGDFGLARQGPQTQYTHMHVSRVQGTLPYLPEEFLRSKVMSEKVDTFSFGIVLFELGTGLRAYDDARPKKLLKDHVESHQEEHIDMLRDTKAGPSEAETFLHLMTLGKWCVSQRAVRPKMEEVLKKLENAPSLRHSPQYPLQMTSASPSTPYPAVTPVPFKAPINVSPEPNSHVSPVYHLHQHAQLSPKLLAAVHNNNPFLYVNYGQRVKLSQEEMSPPSLENRLQQNQAVVNGHHQESPSRDHAALRLIMPSGGMNVPQHRDVVYPSDRAPATIINERDIPQPVIAISPPSANQPCNESSHNMNISSPSTMNTGSSASSGSLSCSKPGGEEAAPMPSASGTDLAAVIPLITELGMTEPPITARNKQLCI
ncbi:interleukin-1 receptor-associated kinase 4 isoform X2 [Anabrus simplex]|uniref:interleukin-1 receptor-associated kinase 4 isoform X2 n=1 Tax=Anabrus simplex TaxID=316456 RepID=UPI0035A37489